MFYECKIFDPKGNLKHIITAEEQEKAFNKLCLEEISKNQRDYIINFDEGQEKLLKIN